MTVRRPLVRVAGSQQQLPAGDRLPSDSVFATGDALITARNPGAGWLEQGKVYAQASYPDLFGIIGLLPDGPPGAIWTSAGTSPRAANMYANIDDYNIIGVGNGVIFRSADGGESFSTESVAWNLTGVWVTNTGVWITHGSGGAQTLMLSVDDGTTFSAVTRPSTSGSITQVIESNHRVFVLANGVPYYSDDQGATAWTYTGENNRILMLSLGDNIIISFQNNSMGVRRSVNNGTTWANGTSLPANGPLNSYTGYTDGQGLALVTGNGGTYRTTDHAATWNTSTNGLSGNAGGHIVRVGNRIILPSANTMQAAHRYSDDLGATFLNATSLAGGAATALMRGRLKLELAGATGINLQTSSYLFTYDDDTLFRVPRIDVSPPLRGYVKT